MAWLGLAVFSKSKQFQSSSERISDSFATNEPRLRVTGISDSAFDLLARFLDPDLAGRLISLRSMNLDDDRNGTREVQAGKPEDSDETQWRIVRRNFAESGIALRNPTTLGIPTEFTRHAIAPLEQRAEEARLAKS
jgi:hypothetical protein